MGKGIGSAAAFSESLGDVVDAGDPAVSVLADCGAAQADLDGAPGQGFQAGIAFRVPLDTDGAAPFDGSSYLRWVNGESSADEEHP